MLIVKANPGSMLNSESASKILLFYNLFRKDKAVLKLKIRISGSENIGTEVNEG
jgi:hypothetical protein